MKFGVIGMQRIMRECWVLAGFAAEAADEQVRIDNLRDAYLREIRELIVPLFTS